MKHGESPGSAGDRKATAVVLISFLYPSIATLGWLQISRCLRPSIQQDIETFHHSSSTCIDRRTKGFAAAASCLDGRSN
ncbi:hypothetical protein-transmembrane prediction [Rhodopirellula baltica SH 1]|uniref:Uncharacterized protein n=1 Tax=Rhodopirellula baltica (strain DSM 10527 / NCIMB 13988 / SH1) TaxID=243090 RepID=Q7UK33_RHOBA|nr:hypothetical protein-transmembrane prediction [Rhodopirellula baltica SH 1]